MAKNSDALKTAENRRLASSTPPKLKAEDWEALLKYSKHTGKLRLHSSKIIQDPGTVHRLLANKLILPDGRLTRQAISKCEELSRQMRMSFAGPTEDPIGSDNNQSKISITTPRIDLSDADWTILMTHDRQTGHLLKYDSRTGRLDQGSLEIIRDTGAVRRLLKNKLIYPGGELTSLGKRECERRERELRKESPVKNINYDLRHEVIPDSQSLSLSEEIQVSEIESVSEPKLLMPVIKTLDAENNDVQREEDFDTSLNKKSSGMVDKNLISLLDPQCFESEQFKILRTNLFVPVTGKAPRSLLVTSVAPGEGKSFVSTNLAISVAKAIDRHVLLMDCDLRRPTIHSLLGFGKVEGLSDYLTKGTSLPTLLRKTKVPKLTVLPAGKPPHNPAELLSSDRMADLVNEVSERYSDRFIIVDSPPPRLTAETFVLASQVDGIVLVVKYGSTPRDMVAELISKMGKDRILGCVVNHFDVRTPGYRYRYYGKYYGTYTQKKKKFRGGLFSGKRKRSKK